MRWAADPTGRFPKRPYYEEGELDRLCEQVISDFLIDRYGKVLLPIPTEDLTVLIERDAEDLDLFADLSAEEGEFVSVMAGTLLAAETFKDVLGADTPLSDQLPRATLQFWHPTARTNGASRYGRDPKCPMCRPGEPGTDIWRRRFVELQPRRAAG